MNNVYVINASVHKEIKDGYRVKVSMEEIGMFINGMVIYPPNEKHEDWKVLTPAMKFGYKYVHTIEFNSKLQLWAEIREACIEAVKKYQSESSSMVRSDNTNKDVVLEDISDEPIDLSSIPF